MRVFLRRAGLMLLVLSSLSLTACAHQRRSHDPYADYGYGGQRYDPPAYRGQVYEGRGYEGRSYEGRGYEGRGGYGQYGQYADAESGSGRVLRIDALRGRHAQQAQGGGALIGGVIGGLIGNQMGKGDGRTAATVAGVVGGALIGNELERHNSTGQGGRAAYRVTVRLDDGSERQFDFERLDGLRVGEPVRIERGRLQRW